MPLQKSTVFQIQSSLPLLKLKSLEISSKMYEILFIEHPQVKTMFTHKEHQINLSQAIIAYASNIDDLEIIKPVLINISKKHVTAKVNKQHYLWVGSALLKAMSEVLGSAFSVELASAWKDAYVYLATFMIETEQNMRQLKYSSSNQRFNEDVFDYRQC